MTFRVAEALGEPPRTVAVITTLPPAGVPDIFTSPTALPSLPTVRVEFAKEAVLSLADKSIDVPCGRCGSLEIFSDAFGVVLVKPPPDCDLRGIDDQGQLRTAATARAA